MKLERCLECGLMYDRHVRGAECPHCNAFNWLYFIGGLCMLIGATAAAGVAYMLWL
jgi:hypothetical protein